MCHDFLGEDVLKCTHVLTKTKKAFKGDVKRTYTENLRKLTDNEVAGTIKYVWKNLKDEEY